METNSEIQIGDQIISVNGIEFSNNSHEENFNLLFAYEEDDLIQIRYQHEEEVQETSWQVSGFTEQEFSERINSQWWLGYLFWFSGTITFLIIRPRDTRWFLFITLMFLTAIWLTTGGGISWYNLFQSRVIYRFLLWLSIPIMVHFHWIFPDYLRPLSQKVSRWVRIFSYGLFIILGIVDIVIGFNRNTPIYSLLISLVICVIFLTIHAFNKEKRKNLRFILIGTVLAILPLVLVGLFSMVADIPVYAYGGALIPFGLLPFSYFYAIARKQLKQYEVRTNRVISVFLFSTILFLGILLSTSLTRQSFPNFSSTHFYSLILGLITALISIYYFQPFQRFVEKRLLNIPFIPEKILREFTSRISSTSEMEQLSNLLVEGIFQSLQIRQSAIYEIKNQETQLLKSDGLQDFAIPSQINANDLLQFTGYSLSSEDLKNLDPIYQWLQFVQPVNFNERLVGIWLLGKHDPNDYYDVNTIQTLSIIAQQTGLAVINHRQAENLRAVYQANIDRHENERANLARDLHDDTLNTLGVIKQNTSDPKMIENIDQLIHNLRETIHGLRPEMLNFGLIPAIQDLGYTLNGREEDILITSSLEGTPSSFNPIIELHFFRIIQQACENAIKHGNCNQINISGLVSPEKISLSVQDNGKGLGIEMPINRSSLLEKKHYGLSNMLERAHLIHAKIDFHSNSDGVKVDLTWIPEK